MIRRIVPLAAALPAVGVAQMQNKD